MALPNHLKNKSKIFPPIKNPFHFFILALGLALLYMFFIQGDTSFFVQHLNSNSGIQNILSIVGIVIVDLIYFLIHLKY
jgi:hypothetical protein